MAKLPAGFKLAAKVAQKELPKLQAQRSKLVKELNDLDETIMLTQNIIALWQKKSGEDSSVVITFVDTNSGPGARAKDRERTAFHKTIADILKNGRSLSVKELVPLVSKEVGRPVSAATIYSAILRKREIFERKGKGYRLRKQRKAAGASLAESDNQISKAPHPG